MASLKPVVFLAVVISCCIGPVISDENTTCSVAMFGGDHGAYLACIAQFAHQCNWFPSPIAGLYSYQVCESTGIYSFIFLMNSFN